MDESLQISGRWINKKNGDIINVHNNIIDGDQMIIITDKGNLTMDEFSNYIQVSDDIYNEQGQVINNSPIEINDIKIEDDYSNLLNIPIGNKGIKNIVVDKSIEKPKQLTNNNTILNKFFENEKSVNLNIDITFNFDINELKTVMKYVDLNVNDICEYLYDKIINKQILKEQIKNTVYTYLE